MFHVKNFMQEEKLYISIMMSLLLNTICSRLVDQTDLIMIRRLSQDAAAALISAKSISFLDFIIALSIVPIFGILIRKTESQTEKEILAARLLKFFFIISLITTLICAFVYPLLILFSIKDADLKSMCLVLIVFVVLNLPCKMLQFLLSTFLCIFQEANFVSLFWIITVFANFVLNYVLIYFLGYIGCLISTVVVTIIVSVSFFIKLNKNFHLTQYFKSNATLVEIPFMPIISEGSRIIIEQVSSYLFFLITIHFCNRSDFTNIGIISTITGLFLVPSIASMRGTALSLSSQIQSIKNKLILNCIISIIIIFIFISCSETIIVKLYGISNYDSTLFKLFRISLPFLIFIKSIDAVIRGKIQFHLKQKMLFKIDTAVTWGLYLPLSFLLFSILKCYFFPVILLFQALTELIIIVFATKTSMYTQ